VSHIHNPFSQTIHFTMSSFFVVTQLLSRKSLCSLASNIHYIHPESWHTFVGNYVCDIRRIHLSHLHAVIISPLFLRKLNSEEDQEETPKATWKETEVQVIRMLWQSHVRTSIRSYSNMEQPWL
jgi:hypothetical protein